MDERKTKSKVQRPDQSRVLSGFRQSAAVSQDPTAICIGATAVLFFKALLGCRDLVDK